MDKQFWDWHSEWFGFGYGTGEEHVLPALRKFFSLLTKHTPMSSWGYDYRELEKELTPTVAWLLINILCKADVIEYGTSPRVARIDSKYDWLREYFLNHTEEELYKIACESWDDMNP